MGSTQTSPAGSSEATCADVSRIIKEEKVTWQNKHSLKINAARSKEQVAVLGSCFKQSLFLGCTKCSFGPLQYKHFFITDGTWTLEFLTKGVSLHCNPLPHKWEIVEGFTLTPAVLDRMMLVCGATAYSLLLRNGEHLARYVKDGRWLSLQTLSTGALRKSLIQGQDVPSRLNQPPDELLEKLEKGKKVTPVLSVLDGFVVSILL